MEDIRGKINVKKLTAELRYLAAIVTAKKRYAQGGWMRPWLVNADRERFNRLCVLRALHRGRKHWPHLSDKDTAAFIEPVLADFRYKEIPVEPTEHEKKELREARLSRKLHKIRRHQKHLSRVHSSMAEHQGG